MRALANKLHLELSELYAVGDSENDMSMLEIVGHPYICLLYTSLVFRTRGLLQESSRLFL